MKTRTDKKALAEWLGISRSTLYYQLKQPAKDWKIKQEIENVLKDHHSYGHKRIADKIKRNRKSVLRVMKIYGIKPYKRRRGKKGSGKGSVSGKGSGTFFINSMV